MDMFSSLHLSRRRLIGAAIAVPFAAFAACTAHAADASLSFDELYGKFGVLGLEFSDKVKRLAGQGISMKGFMAPPLKAEAQFFVLTEVPMSLCPFCSSDADWPDNIVVVYLSEKQTFVQPRQTIEVRGTLEYGSWTDPETGFVSLLRIRQAEYFAV
ncbi:hypothetical protein [Rhizobium lentis]|uniref:hypothetical protein n=1 Tax=Rhizobium lentis TaxID=1138194 RepID=UPI001A92B3F7|nr:hypothetical protein [Rhizobium lentis]MBX5067886.1 hypothetical protein [Rhizobium lentis]MBX5079828.1 hypothetical protein [Rhizobium lentis]QSW95252.1 hypothetical protein J0663_08510 [Rhizobium lentis]